MWPHFLQLMYYLTIARTCKVCAACLIPSSLLGCLVAYFFVATIFMGLTVFRQHLSLDELLCHAKICYYALLCPQTSPLHPALG